MQAEAENDNQDGINLREEDKVKAREAARIMGSIRTPKKAAAARVNSTKRQTFGGPAKKDPLSIPCDCGAGTDTEVGTNHKFTCPRGRFLYDRARREAAKERKQKAGGE